MPVSQYSAKPADRSNVAAVVLTLNEEHNIRRCLDHLSWVDEIVVLDSGSYDRTCEIARAIGASVIINKPDKFIISDQRNWAIDNAGVLSEWILFVDADEVVTVELRDALLSAISSAPSDLAAFRLCPKFIFMGRWLRHVLDFPAWHDRLLRRGAARYGGGVWEHFETNGKIGYIKEPYLHYGLSNGISEWLCKHQRYAKWKAETISVSRDTAEQDGLKPAYLKLGWPKRSIHDLQERCGTRLGVFSTIMRFSIITY